MSDYIPEEIVDKILLRLPIKSLMKCTAVCKSWNSLIKSSTFIGTHLSSKLQFNNENDVQLLLLHRTTEKARPPVYSLHWDNPEIGEYTNLVTPIYNNIPFYVSVVGTCNGLVCLYNYSTHPAAPIIIWNPSIRKFVFSPIGAATYDSSYAFGYDSSSNDYKVLIIGKAVCDHKLWSLGSNSWKSISSDIAPSNHTFNNGRAFVYSAVHWVQYDWIDKEDDDNDIYIVSIFNFNMVNESFGEVELPRDLKVREVPETIHVSKYGESLALLEFASYGDVESFDVWVMKEYGVAESWTPLVTIDMHMPVFHIQPIGVRKTQVVVEVLDSFDHRVLKSVDLKSKQVEEICIDGYEYHFMDCFLESIVLLDQANAISY